METLIQENIALAPLTTLKVGGAARFFVEAKSENDIWEAVIFAKQNDLPLFVLGGGSNILISDNGFNGLVIKNSLKGISIFEKDEAVLVTAQSGEDWDEFVNFCVGENLQGIECLSGIPGTVGGTPVQNVGAYGQEVSETIEKVRVLERETGEIFDLSNTECGFNYRTSIFNTTQKEKYIVLAVTFRLKPNGKPKIVYKDLQQIFDDQTPDLFETRQEVIKIRAAKSMVIDKNDPNSKSAGSFFKNPILTNEKFIDVEARAKNLEIESVPNYIVDEKSVKIPAAWLIEKSGFYKGYVFGNVGLSEKHTLALINRGNAKAQDILNLKDEIQKKVKEIFDVELIPEPILVGFE